MRTQRVPSNSGTRGSLRPWPALALLAIFLVAAAPESSTPPPTAGATTSILTLTDGGFVAGDLKDSEKPEVFRWQSKAFASPFEFERKNVSAIHFPALPKPPKPTGDYCFELAGGDVAYGSLIDLNEKTAVIELPRFGRLHVLRSHLHRVQRWRDSADLIYLGPNGLNGWQETSTTKSWREELGQLLSETEGSAVRNDLGLPAQASVEFEISWKSKPDFLFALGVDGNEKTLARAFRFEVWRNDLVVHRETDDEADVASVGQVTSGSGRIHLQAYIDQEKGRILVFTPNGVQLADMKISVPKPQTHSGVYLGNIKGDVRLERLRIGRWNGEAPKEANGDQARVHRSDGTIAYGQVQRFDAATKEFVIRQGEAESRVPEGQISGVFLSFPEESKGQSLSAVLHDGTRLSGETAKLENGEVWLTIPGIEEKLPIPLAEIQSLVVAHRDTPASSSKETVTSRFEMEGTRLIGSLEEGHEKAGISCLVWHPVGSLVGSALKPGISGRIIYKDLPKEPVAATPRPQVRQQPQAVGVLEGFLAAYSGGQGAQPAKKPRSLYLRTGDIVPCEVTKIDEAGVSIRTPISDSTFVPHDKIKAVELAAEAVSTVHLTRTKRDRLLTLPRMQKDSPPLQLIRSKSGDYLRGRIVKMDDKTLQLEVRLESKDLPRNRIARIIWLHPEDLDETKKAAKAKAETEQTRIQAVRNDGTRMTFFPEEVVGRKISGKSDILGTCHINLDDTDQILIGGDIEQAALQLAYQQWKLRNAQEPKFVQADSDTSQGGGNQGTESPLVGKPAPDFTLNLLDGKKFHLTDAKGKVVILDFWATWCGPCLQAMPQVERVAHEFEDQGVQLVAVNLQEEPKAISSMLERHKLKVTVALDSNGAIAEKYAATAIPQTVIINREGTVSYLFVGGGPHLEEQLRNSLRSVLGKGEPAGEAPKK